MILLAQGDVCMQEARKKVSGGATRWQRSVLAGIMHSVCKCVWEWVMFMGSVTVGMDYGAKCVSARPRRTRSPREQRGPERESK
jgi:hypothetical protein